MERSGDANPATRDSEHGDPPERILEVDGLSPGKTNSKCQTFVHFHVAFRKDTPGVFCIDRTCRFPPEQVNYGESLFSRERDEDVRDIEVKHGQAKTEKSLQRNTKQKDLTTLESAIAHPKSQSPRPWHLAPRGPLGLRRWRSRLENFTFSGSKKASSGCLFFGHLGEAREILKNVVISSPWWPGCEVWLSQIWCFKFMATMASNPPGQARRTRDPGMKIWFSRRESF